MLTKSDSDSLSAHCELGLLTDRVSLIKLAPLSHFFIQISFWIFIGVIA